MNKHRFTLLLVGFTSIILIGLAFWNFIPAFASHETSHEYSGMGDLRQLEARTNVNNSRSYVGMGDLHRFEAIQIGVPFVRTGYTVPYIGMGDLRRVEFAANLVQINYSGMGGLHLYESTQR